LIKLFGIGDCDTVRKARRWLDDRALDYRFHDFRKDGLLRTDLERWCDTVGWESLLNRRSATWRQLPAQTKTDLDGALAQDLMLGNPTLIRRPVLEGPEVLLVGFSEQDYEQLLPPDRIR
jgi:Spx/MgsR family transcriptional regulator